jgi:hypothetical protein
MDFGSVQPVCQIYQVFPPKAMLHNARMALTKTRISALKVAEVDQERRISKSINRYNILEYSIQISVSNASVNNVLVLRSLKSFACSIFSVIKETNHALAGTSNFILFSFFDSSLDRFCTSAHKNAK